MLPLRTQFFEERSLANRALVRLRWIALGVQSFFLVPGYYFGFFDPGHLSWSLMVIGIGVVGGLFFWKRAAREKSLSSVDTFLQLGFDLSILATLLGLAGGVWNPFFSLVFIHAAIGALILEGLLLKLLYLVLVATALIVLNQATLPITVQRFPLDLSLTVPCHLFVALLAWRLSSWIADGQRQLKERLLILEERRTGLDRLRAMGAVASGISHEMATPLNTIRMRLERVSRRFPESQAEVQPALEAFADCERALRSLNIKTLSPDHLELQSTDLSVFLSELIESWQMEHPTAHIEFLDCPSRAVVQLPRIPFSRSFLDILDNSSEALTAHSQPVKISIELKVQGSNWALVIRDAGPGLPEIVRRQWGEPFVTTKSDGTGLGLYNALNLARALGGDLEPSSAESVGCSLAWSIPREVDA
jgi:two-component system sensor histidine kinase RegB